MNESAAVDKKILLDIILMSSDNGYMKTITIRKISDDVYEALVKVAKRNKRSIQQQAVLLLGSAKILAQNSPVTAAQKVRENLEGRELGNTVKELRSERRR